MIIDRKENADSYRNLSSDIAEALDLIKSGKIDSSEDGKYEIRGEEFYYVCSTYETKPIDKSRLEAHRKYIDLQYVISGREFMGYAPSCELSSDDEYNSSNDVIFYRNPDVFSKLEFKEGMFAIFFPQDGHAPGIQTGGPAKVKKAVFKIAV